MPGLMASFADLRLAGVTLAQWMDTHAGSDFPKMVKTTYKQWESHLHRAPEVK